MAVRAQRLRGPGGACGHGVGDENHLAAADARPMQQLAGPLEGQIGAAARRRHHLRRQGREQMTQRLGIVGERRHHERVSGVRHQSRLGVGAMAQHVRHLQTRAHQSRRLDVGGFHGAGEIEDDDARGTAAVERLLEALPARSRQRDHADQPREREQPQRQRRAGTARVDDEVRQQMGIAQCAPTVTTAQLPPQQPHQRRTQRQQQQPPGSQPVQCARIHGPQRSSASEARDAVGPRASRHGETSATAKRATTSRASPRGHT